MAKENVVTKLIVQDRIFASMDVTMIRTSSTIPMYVQFRTRIQPSLDIKNILDH